MADAAAHDDGLPVIADAATGRLLVVRGFADDATLADRVLATTGLIPPRAPGRVAESGPTRLIWLEPTAWLLEADDTVADRAIADLGAIEVTDGRVVLALSGARVRDLLAVGTGLDLDPALFPPGHATRTLFGRLGVLLHAVDAAPTYRLHVDRAHARWFRDWILAARRDLDL